MTAPVDHEAAAKTARFWDQWSRDDCQRMAAAYLALRTELEAANAALREAAIHAATKSHRNDWIVLHSPAIERARR